MDAWELVARERIRDSLARYNWSGDAFRLDELASSFCEDGELEIRGRAPLRGRDAIVGFLGRRSQPGSDEARRAALMAEAAAAGVRRVVRHNLTNVRFLEVTPETAQVASYFTVVTEIGLDHFGRYRLDHGRPVDCRLRPTPPPGRRPIRRGPAVSGGRPPGYVHERSERLRRSATRCHG